MSEEQHAKWGFPEVPAFLIAFSGAVALALIVLLPEVLPALAGREGYVWTPFNSSNYLPGDMYYYAPMVQQILNGHVPPSAPNALVLNGMASPDYFRWLSAAFFALPGLIFSDPRLPLLWGLVLPPVAGFIVAFALCYRLTRARWASLYVGIFSTMYLQFWYAIPAALPSLSVAGFETWFDRVSRYWDLYWYRSTEIYDTYLYSDMFRFMLPAGAYVLLAAFLLLLVYLDRVRRPLVTTAAFPAACLMLFSFPSHTFAAYMFMVMYAGLSLMERDWRGLIHFLCLGLATLVFLAVFGIPVLLGSAVSQDTFLAALSETNEQFEVSFDWSKLPALVVSKYTLSFGLALWLSWSSPGLRRLVIVVGVTALIMSLAEILPKFYSNRFLRRGIDHSWLLVLTIVVFTRGTTFADQVFSRALKGRVGQYWDVIKMGAAVSLAVLLLSLPATGFHALLERNLAEPRRFVPAGQWEAYSWLAKNANGETVAALNWEDVEFIAVYLPNVRTVYSNADLANRRPEKEVARFVSVWKQLGLSRDAFRDWVQRSVASEHARRTRFKKAIKSDILTPFLSTDDYVASRIALALIYFPYVRKFDGVDVSSEQDKKWSASEAFVERMLLLYDATRPEGYLENEGVRFIVLSAYEEGLIDKDRLASWRIVWQSQERKVYRRASR